MSKSSKLHLKMYNVSNNPLIQHLDHLQQLDNLEHSAHLYGQLTTVGCFTTFGQYRSVCRDVIGLRIYLSGWQEMENFHCLSLKTQL
jgi:hypothetical protein